MKESVLKNLLGIGEDVDEIILDIDTDNIQLNNSNKEKIKILFDIANKNRFVMYFDGRAVEEPYDGLEFKNEEEEFYYNNGNSYLVFHDIFDFKAKIKIKSLRDYKYEEVYKVIKKAVEFTKSHPEVSDYKLY